ncbi:MAG: 4-(cytidine 5'-diphospho)-2-C-methyl-D-erythritol kinase [Candidatus Syntrophonatronum acetioxidans]|uniref:4-diphosphocytidyl-2-C-methyl-D-erythritol kinase n=1 Tax=Candidatus Syntrophonatronum acetioxidans TaxID=1795816 RepID=A0A424YCE0_9FIRM|nr:MAG: 4-(cytidine 5'-diphospho)-2-C-methyl-D-erythritol kinase [Candidatus Syntrophonatronum acetioxidans]
MHKIFFPAKAKINISLDVLHKRPDGFHQVEMIMQSIALADMVILEENTSSRVNFYCSHPQVPRDDSNLVIKAANLLRENSPRKKGCNIKLEKKIPLGAGLAGGSTDAAAVLLALNRLWELNMSLEELMELGSKLGSDIPFCMKGGTCLAQGRGELLEELPALPSLWVLLVVFPFSVSTAEIYGGLDLNKIEGRPHTTSLLSALKDQDIKGMQEHMGNVLEGVTLHKYPQVARVKEELYERGLRGVQMTGSGPTLFCLSSSREELEKPLYSPPLEGVKVMITKTV